MKKTMFVLGIVAPVMIIIATIFKTQHWPGAGILLTLGLFTLGLIFLPMFVMIKIRDTREQKKPVNFLLYITGLIAGILFIAGALFKIMHWPGAGIVLILSLFSVLVLFIPMLVLYIIREKENRLTNFSFLIFLLSFIAIFYMTYALRVSKDVLDGFIITENSLTAQVDYLKLQSEKIVAKASESQPSEVLDNMKMVRAESDKICDFIQSVKIEMLMAVEPENRNAVSGDNKIDFQKVTGKDAFDAPEIVLMGESGRDGQAVKLKQMLEAYRGIMVPLLSDAQLQSFLQSELNLLPPGNELYTTWEQYYFAYGPLVYKASNLSLFQNTVRLVELETLRELDDRLQE